ncbi:phage tail tape measure protein [Glaciibacter psychrotolerans]|uniref:TP901 family phage tail tape measure protein n=1 Tax=Glaciibacter psychrotolerans TaxID=670054 RepID=A0A7Z0J5B0_9MICO|nr:phage tail tape measure protein [Leifsonia psychrotolerans]NYJ19205.1 TP901 family phage tail tape measure protein [Leifsonia psychrotolerans]
MTDRKVKVVLGVDASGLVTGMDLAAEKTKKVTSESGKLNAKLAEQKAAMATAGAGITAFGALAAVGVGIAVNKFAEFDQAMSEVKASTHESAENMALLRDAAMVAGASTVFSATEAANAVDELAKAGISTADIIGGGLSGALDLASAGGLGVADAAGIAATALTQFKLKGSDIPHVADLLAAGAGKAMGSVQDLSQALNQGGLIASQTGLSIEETTGTLSAFAAAGLLGSDAGTSMKTMLQRLTPQSAEAAAKMDKLGISAYDAQGQFIGMEKFAGVLQGALKDLSPEARNSALSVMFGSDAVRAASVVYDQGAKGIGEWIGKVDDAGYAAETARLKLDNLRGDTEALGGAFDTALIKMGSAADGSLRLLTQTATELLDIFNAAPLPIQQTALVIGAVAAAAALAGGAFLLTVPKIAEFSAALATLTTSTMPGVAAGAVAMQGAIAGAGKAIGAAATFMTGPFGIALAAAAVGIAILTKALDGAKSSADEVDNSLRTASSAAQILAVASKGVDATFLAEVKLGAGDVRDALESAAHSSTNFFDALSQTNGQKATLDVFKRAGEGLGRLASSDLPAAQAGFRMLSDEYKLNTAEQWRMLNTMPDYLDALKSQANELGINVTSSDEAANKTNLLKLAFGNAEKSALTAADAYMKAADETSGLKQELSTLIDTINEANGIGQDAVSQNIKWQNSLADADEAIRKAREGLDENNDGVADYTLTLDQATQSGRDNMEMITGLAGDYQTAAAAQFALDGSTETYVANLAAGRDAVLQRARDLGATDEQIQFLSDHIVNMPSEKEIKIIAETTAAAARLADIQARMDRISAGATGTVTLHQLYQDEARSERGSANGNMFVGDVAQPFANGGFPTGIYKGRPGGIHRFAEQETGWEAYISGKPGMEERNRSIALDALGRLGPPQYAPSRAQYAAGSSVSGDTFQATFQLAPAAGRSLSDQAFEAARRLKIRR